MKIINSTTHDLERIFNLYGIATAYQQTKFNKHWLPFEKQMVEREIAQNRQWKIIEGDDVACIFAIAYEDPFIWGKKNADPAVYIHRIVTDPQYRGRNYVKKIIDWAREHAKQHDKLFLRMDTWGDNEELIRYYQQCGFTYLGSTTPEASDQLPKHYSAIFLALFEIALHDHVSNEV